MCWFPGIHYYPVSLGGGSTRERTARDGGSLDLDVVCYCEYCRCKVFIGALIFLSLLVSDTHSFDRLAPWLASQY